MRFHAKLKKFHITHLYIITCLIVSWDFIYTYIALRNGSVETNPIGAFFVSMFGPTYFLIGLPLAWLFVCLALEFAGWIVKVARKRRQLNGPNDAAFAMILLLLPNVLEQITSLIIGHRLIPNWEYKHSLFAGLFLVLIYVIITEYELWQNEKRRIKRHKQ